MNFSLGLKRQHIIEDTQTVDIGKCLHTLQSYVYEHWFDHVLALISTLRGIEDEQLQESLEHLVSIIQIHQRNIGTEKFNFSPESISSVLDSEPRLEHVRQYEYIFEAFFKITRYRHMRISQFRATAFAGK